MDEVDEVLLSEDVKNSHTGINSSKNKVTSTSVEHKDIKIIPKNDEANSENLLSEKNQIPHSRLWLEVVVSCILSFASIAVGCNFGFTGIVLPSMMNSTSDVNDDIVLTKDEAALFSSSIIIGSMLASVLAAPILVRIGQKMSLIFFSILGIIGVIMESCSHYYWLLISSRLILGICSVVIGSSLSSYIAEIAHPIQRGKLLAIPEVARQVGFVYVFIVGSTNLGWRKVGLISGLGPAIVPLLILPFLPKSPRWLVTRGRIEEAKGAIAFYRGSQYDNDVELKKIIDDVSQTSKKAKSFVSQLRLLGKRSILKRFALLTYMLLSLHFTGNFIMIFYAVTLFQSTGSNLSEYMSTILIGLIRVVGGIIYIIISDRIRRRLLLLPCLFMIGICSMILGVYFHLEANDFDTSSLYWLPLLVALAFNLAVSFSFPILFLSRSELLPNSVRSLATTLLYLPLFTGAFVVTLTYPYMVANIGSDWTFWVYTINTFILATVCYFTIPETKGKTLEEINEMYQKRKKTDTS